MKQSILVAALTVFVAFLANEANAQVFQKGACYSTVYCRVGLFPRLGLFSRCRFTTYAQPTPSTLTKTPEKVEFPPSCSGGTCLVDPVGREEYYPTDEGNVPVERKTLLEIVNATRARYGLRALTVDASLERGAIAQATFCSQIGGLRHAGGVAEILAQNTSDFNGAIRQWTEQSGALCDSDVVAVHALRNRRRPRPLRQSLARGPIPVKGTAAMRFK